MVDNTWLVQRIADFAASSPANRFANGLRIWDAPLVGFAAGDDPYFNFFKQDIGEFYLSPGEFMELTYGKQFDSGTLTVVSWILPQTKATKDANAAMDTYPAREWAEARLQGEEFNRILAQHMVDELEKLGLKAVSPLVSPYFAHKTSEKYGYASTWSERHTAFVAGLGTFGLCDGLITPVGKAIRCGSVIVDLKLEPSPRNYAKHNEYCLFYNGGACFACAERCPVGAIGPNGHDKAACREYLAKTVADFTRVEYNLVTSCCGLCQTGVPCADGNPK